jgi:hypothetical protein
MPLAGFEPTIPVFKRAKTFHALDRAATVTGSDLDYLDLRNHWEESVDSEWDTGCASQKDSEQIHVFNLNAQFRVYLRLLTQRSFMFEY